MFKEMKKAERVFQKIDELGPDVNLEVAVASSKADGAVMSSGITKLTDSSFEWTFGVNEVLYGMEGELKIKTPDREYLLASGDMLYCSAGEKVVLSAEGEALYLWVTYPTE